MAKNKYTLITIIVILAISLPAAIYGTIMRFSKNDYSNNPNQDGKLYLYNAANELLGTYNCESVSCNLAIFDNGEEARIINNSYTFINDGGMILLYDINSKKVIDSYNKVNYENEKYIVSKDGLYGVITITDKVNKELDVKYNEVKVKDNVYAVSENDSYKIISNNKSLYETNSEIIDFNNSYVVLFDNGSISIMDFSGKRYFTDALIEYAYIMEDYFVIQNDNTYSIYTIASGIETLVDNFTYTGDVRLTYEVNDNSLDIYTGSEVQKTIELN